MFQDEILESPVCKIHCKDGSTHYMEAFDATAIPTVRLQIKSFAAKVHTLLQVGVLSFFHRIFLKLSVDYRVNALAEKGAV